MLLKLGSTGEDVKKWQNFLIQNGYLITSDGDFGPQTNAATRSFQLRHGLVVDGVVGNITWNYAESLHHPSPNIIHSNKEVLQWIKTNLSSFIVQAVFGSVFTEDWLSAIACRETGGLITRYANRGVPLEDMHSLMKGDYTNNTYHGFSYFQIDIRSFPEFIASGDWKDPQKSANKAVQVLEQKKSSLISYHINTMNLTPEIIDRAITASYNCGAENTIEALRKNEDVDSHTTGHDYSRQVFAFREIYRNLKKA